MPSLGICKKIYAYLDNQLNKEEEKIFEKHLSACALCAALVRDWQQSKSLFFQETKAVLNNDFNLKLMNALPENAQKNRSLTFKPVFIRLALAVSVVILLVSIYFSFAADRQQIEDVLIKNSLLNDSLAYENLDNIFEYDDYIFW